MPLRDHFHPPLSDREPWEGFHNAWANTIVRHLNAALLPERYRAVPQISLGSKVEVDVATLEEAGAEATPPNHGNGVATAVWAPPKPTQTLAVTFPAQDLFEVQVYHERSGRKLVAAVEFVSPGNKDRPDSRRTFAVKCASYLQAGVGLLVVDVVTSRRENLFEEMMRVLQLADALAEEQPALYAVASRTTKRAEAWQLDNWAERLTLGERLPTVPLHLASNLAVPLDLEETYEETRRVLRIR